MIWGFGDLGFSDFCDFGFWILDLGFRISDLFFAERFRFRKRLLLLHADSGRRILSLAGVAATLERNEIYIATIHP